jgi:hypothetical protein
MRPFTVLIGILMGSAASITFGLASVLIVFCLLIGIHPELSNEHPELSNELPRLVMSLAVFILLTAASAGSFLGQVRNRPWRPWAHAGTTLCVAGVIFYYWPRK